MTLTVKQETFCQHFVSCGVASDAYRQAYRSENMLPTTINRKASELLANGMITARIDELRQDVRDKFSITMDEQVHRYFRLLEEAESVVQDPKSRIELETKILTRLDKIGGLERGNRTEQAVIVLQVDEKDLQA